MPNKPEYIIIHHTGGTNANPKADTSHHTASIIKAGHLANGWKDIGYNYVITKNGVVEKGRAENQEGAHTIGYNSKSIGICISGNFDVTYPTVEQENALKELLGALQTKYKIPIENIVPHRKFARKTCYGSLLKDDWGQNLVKKIHPEIKDGSQACKDYMKTQSKSSLSDWITYIFTMMMKK